MNGQIQPSDPSTLSDIVDLFNEVGMLALIPRSGFAFLGSGQQSVSEHSFRTTFIAYALARLVSEPIDLHKLIMISLVHDLPESLIGDLNYVQKRYLKVDVEGVLKEMQAASFLGPEIVTWIKEYEAGESLESKLVHDADQLELLLVLKREGELGNEKTKDWIENTLKRMQTDVGKQMAQAICHTSSDRWWLKDKSDPHWIDGGKGRNTPIS